MNGIYYAGLALILAACGAENRTHEIIYTEDQCGPNRYVNQIYNGTEQPSYIPLSDSQIMAIGTFGGCTGTLVNERWVVTAKHCRLDTDKTFCTGTDPKRPNICANVEVLHNHPSRDVTLVKLDRALTDELSITPIPIVTTVVKSDLVGKFGEAAGYGQQEDFESGELLFTREPISQVSDAYVTIDGQGQRGACFGDSGGPLFIMTDSGPAIVGALSNGDSSCLGIDNYARVDKISAWIESYTGPIGLGDDCGGFDDVGRCFDGLSARCENGRLVTSQCEGVCGWDTGDEGFRCLTGEDPCQGVDAFGKCDGNTALWCQDGEFKVRDCGCASDVCREDGSKGGAFCVEDPCQGVSYQGECSGDVARWCENEKVVERDCGNVGETCGFANDEVGYYCVPR